MRFLYTGSKEYLSDQTDPDNSIGGYCSKSVIPNRKNNLFADVSYLSTFNESEECRAIIIENNNRKNIEEVFIGYKYDKKLYDIQIAVVELTSDGKMERIEDAKSLPYYAEFIEANITDDEDNSISLDFPEDKKYGIWVKRKVKKQTKTKCSDLLDNREENVIDFEFIIKYNE